MIIDGVFKNNNEQIEEYQAELRRCIYTDANGDPVVSMYFAPDADGVYIRAPSQALFLWGQAVFIITQLLTAGLLHINELDPIRRYLPSYNRPRRAGRYSAFQVIYWKTQFIPYFYLMVDIQHTYIYIVYSNWISKFQITCNYMFYLKLCGRESLKM